MLRRHTISILSILLSTLACSSEIKSNRDEHPSDQSSNFEPPGDSLPSPEPSPSATAIPSPLADPKTVRGSTLEDLKKRIPYIEILSSDHDELFRLVEGKGYLVTAVSASETTAIDFLKSSEKAFVCSNATHVNDYSPTEKGAIETRTTLDPEGNVLTTHTIVTEGESVEETWGETFFKKKKCSQNLCEYTSRTSANDKIVLTQKETTQTNAGIQIVNREKYNEKTGALEVKMEERCRPMPWGSCEIFETIRHDINATGEVTRTLTTTYLDGFLTANSTLENFSTPEQKVQTRYAYKYDEKRGTQTTERYYSIDNQAEENSIDSIKYFALVNGDDVLGHYATQSEDRKLLNHSCSHDTKRKAIVRCYVALEPTNAGSLKKIEVTTEHLIVAVKLEDGSYRPAAIELYTKSTTETTDSIGSTTQRVELGNNYEPLHYSEVAQRTTKETVPVTIPVKDQSIFYEYDNKGRLVKISSTESKNGGVATEAMLKLTYDSGNQAITATLSGKMDKECAIK